MNRKEQQILDMLNEKFAESAEDIRVPERLRKENIVKMLEESNKDFSVKTGEVIDFESKKKSKKQSQTAAIRRSMSIAAMLIIVIGASLLIRMSNETTITKSEPKLNSYNAENMFKTAESYEEIRKDFESVINNQESSSPQTSTPPEGNGSQNATVPSENNGETQETPLGELGEYVIDDNASIAELSGDAPAVEDTLTSLEADIVKVDGEYLYIVTSGLNEETNSYVDMIKVIRANPPESMQTVSVIPLTETSVSDANNKFECIEIFLKDKTLIAIVSRRTHDITESEAYTKYQTAAIYFDISNPESIVKTKEVVQDGTYVAAGIYGNNLCLVTDNEIVSLSQNVIPSYFFNGTEAVTPDASGNIHMVSNSPEASYVFITLTGTQGSEAPVSSCVFLGANGKSVLAGKQSVIIARAFVSVEADENGIHNSLTELYRINISGNSVALAGSCVVEGALRCSPVIDEASGNIVFVATGSKHSALYVYDSAMQFVGWLDGIAPGQKITGVRYSDSVCYVSAGTSVTPVSLADPAKPEKLKEIEASGVGANTVSIGGGRFVEFTTDSNGMKINLYTINTETGFELIDSFDIKGSVKPADSDFLKGVVYSASTSTLSVPVIAYDSESEGILSHYYVFSVEGKDIRCLGIFEHSADGVGDAATRGICVGETLYTVSGKTISAFSISGNSKISKTQF